MRTGRRIVVADGTRRSMVEQVIVTFDGDAASEAERFDMKKRIRAVKQGPNGAIWLLEDRSGGRLLKLMPERS